MNNIDFFFVDVQLSESQKNYISLLECSVKKFINFHKSHEEKVVGGTKLNNCIILNLALASPSNDEMHFHGHGDRN